MDKHIKLLIKSSKEYEQVCENALFEEITNQERISKYWEFKGLQAQT